MYKKHARIAAGLTATVLTVGLVSAGSAAFANAPSTDPRTDTVYNSMPAHPAASHPSFGFDATSTREIGDLLTLGNSARVVQKVTVGMNSWACGSGGWSTGDCVTEDGATFNEPITLHFYEAGDDGAVGDEIDRFTEDFAIPYRPAPDPQKCGVGATQWYDEARDSCQNGMTVPVTFDLSGDNLTLPDDVIVSVTYPTSRFDELAPGPWDSLNLDTVGIAPKVGTDVDRDVLYVDSDLASMYAPGDATGSFHATAGNAGYALNLKITAKPSTPLVEMGTSLADFETDTQGVNLVTREALGAIVPAAGCYYGTAPVTGYDTHGTDGFVVTHYAGYANAFPEDGYVASADFYLDKDAAEGQFTWAHALNNSAGDAGVRDFVFIAGADGDGNWSIGAGNNVSSDGSPTGYGSDPLTVTASGWYTFKHTVYAQDGVLYVDLTVLDAAGNELKTWTLHNSADKIPSIVGGNRYGWLVTNTYANLPMDNVLLGVDRPTAGCAPFADVSPDAGPHYNTHAVAIAWMGLTGRSHGWASADGPVYRPAKNTSRAAMAEFFYREAGSPAITTTKSPFIDVSSNKHSKNYNSHWKAIYWMAEHGYSTGWHTSHGAVYKPGASISRGAVAAFIYRINGSPAVTGSDFIDVSSKKSSSHYSIHAAAIEWMFQQGLSTGYHTSHGAEFRPASSITRSAIAAFMYRAHFNLDG